MIRNCKTHGETEHKVYNRSNGKRVVCKKCNSEQVASRRRRVKLMAVEYKGGCCEVCGYNK